MTVKKPFTTKFLILLAVLCLAAGLYLLRYGARGPCNTCGIFSDELPPAQHTPERTEPVSTPPDEPAAVETSTDRTWAEPLDVEGLKNFYRVSDELYRGAQPKDKGFRSLKEMGINTVVNLRKVHSDRKYISRYELGYEHITFNPLHPEDKEVLEFLQIIAEPSNKPIFVHCLWGADRTGMMCAIYRVTEQGWSKEEAIAEWTEGGFGFHESCRCLVDYFREIDLEEFKRQAQLQ